MWSIDRVERIGSHRPTDDGKTISITCDCGESVSKLINYRSKGGRQLALEECVRFVYDRHGEIVLERAGYKCQSCNGRMGLQRDHIESRAHGRNDRVSNLRILCGGPGTEGCHERRHREAGFTCGATEVQ